MKARPGWWDSAKTVIDTPSAGWFANVCFGVGVLITVGWGGALVVTVSQGRPVGTMLPLLGMMCLLLYICRRLAEISGYLQFIGTLIVCVGRRQRLEGVFSEDDIDRLRLLLGLNDPPPSS